MKPSRIAAAAAVLLSIGAPVRAQTWCMNCVTEYSEVVREARRAAEVLRQLAEARRQYEQLAATYRAISGVRDLGSAVGALGSVGIRNPLPTDPYAVQGLLSGTGGVGGISGNLDRLLRGSIGNSRVYQSPGRSWFEGEINRNGSGLAGAQAAALQLYEAAAQRMQFLDVLRGQISTAPDQATRDALSAQFAAEASGIQNQSLQAQALNNYMQAQIAMQPQRMLERRQNEIADVLMDARARGYAP